MHQCVISINLSVTGFFHQYQIVKSGEVKNDIYTSTSFLLFRQKFANSAFTLCELEHFLYALWNKYIHFSFLNFSSVLQYVASYVLIHSKKCTLNILESRCILAFALEKARVCVNTLNQIMILLIPIWVIHRTNSSLWINQGKGWLVICYL